MRYRPVCSGLAFGYGPKPTGGRELITNSLTPRERILATAYDLFTKRGVHGVGVDEVVEKAGVAKTTLYRHFPSKDDLVIAFLEERERLWTGDVIDRGPRERSSDPEEQLLAIFQELDDWFQRRTDYEACSFIKVLFEVGSDGRVGEACIMHLDRIREIMRSRAELAGLRDAKSLAWELNILLKGSVLCAAEGDSGAARRAEVIAAWLIDRHRVAPDRGGVKEVQTGQ
jgi:AcrR family transcriptional regulator